MKPYQGNDYTEVSDPEMDSAEMINYYELKDFYKLQDLKEKRNITNQGTNCIYLTNIFDSNYIISFHIVHESFYEKYCFVTERRSRKKDLQGIR